MPTDIRLEDLTTAIVNAFKQVSPGPGGSVSQDTLENALRAVLGGFPEISQAMVKLTWDKIPLKVANTISIDNISNQDIELRFDDSDLNSAITVLAGGSYTVQTCADPKVEYLWVRTSNGAGNQCTVRLTQMVPTRK